MSETSLGLDENVEGHKNAYANKEQTEMAFVCMVNASVIVDV
jgi:hypothetical protein